MSDSEEEELFSTGNIEDKKKKVEDFLWKP